MKLRCHYVTDVRQKCAELPTLVYQIVYPGNYLGMPFASCEKHKPQTSNYERMTTEEYLVYKIMKS